MPRRRERAFRWIPPDRNTKWSCTIAGTDVSDYITLGKFPMGLISEELNAEIELDNSGEQYSFKYGDEVIFYMDFTGGSTVQFKGNIEEIKKDDSSGFFKWKIKIPHYTAQLLDKMVTEEFTNAGISTIRKNLIFTWCGDKTQKKSVRELIIICF